MSKPTGPGSSFPVIPPLPPIVPHALPRLSAPTSQPSQRLGSLPPSQRTWRMPKPYQLLRRMIPGRLLFEARDLDTGRRVVVQVLKGVRDEQALVERYAAVAQLCHPQTVRLLDAGVVTQPVPAGYLVREFVAGETLSSVLSRDGRLPLSTAVQLALAILASLEEAHDRGVVHGRLSGEHVLLRQSGAQARDVKVLGYWQPNGPVGELAPCQAPEQQNDEAPTPAVDVFAVGALTYRALTGRFPLYEAGREVLLPELPPGAESLGACLSRAVASSARKRYPDAGSMRQELLRVGAARSWAGGWGDETLAPPAVLRPVRDELMAARPASVWILDDDPALGHPELSQAFENLGRQYRVERIGQGEQAQLLEHLVQARLTPPWVLVYGPRSLRASAALLRLLAQSAEVSRILLSEAEQFERLLEALELGGVDQHLPIPCLAIQAEEAVHRAMRRTRRCCFFYDAIRGQLMRSREGLVALSRELTAWSAG